MLTPHEPTRYSNVSTCGGSDLACGWPICGLDPSTHAHPFGLYGLDPPASHIPDTLEIAGCKRGAVKALALRGSDPI